MSLKVCSNFHFIRAIKDGMVQPVQNVNSRGRPGLTFKRVEDILGFADDRFPCQPPIDRSTRQSATEDELLGEITLKQLKKKCKTKKRKAPESVVLTPKQEPTELEPYDDDLDLKQPLSSLKLKPSNSSKSKKKRAKKNLVVSNEKSLSGKTEHSTDAETSLQSNGDHYAIITVKVECQEVEYSDFQNVNYVTEPPIFDELVGFSGFNSGSNFEIDSGREPICVTNEVSYDHLEHAESIIYLPLNGWEHTEVAHQEMVVPQSPVLLAKDLTREGDVPTLPSVESLSPDKNQSPIMCSSPQTCLDKKHFQQEESNIGIEVSDATADNDLFCMENAHLGNSCTNDLPPNQENGSMSTPVKNICSTSMSYSCSSPVNEMTSVEDNSPSTVEKPLVTPTSTKIELEFLHSNNDSIFLDDDSPKNEDKQILVPVPVNPERKVSNHNYPHEDCQYSERQQLPERFPSTRKVISPTSQKKLCLAMKTCESLDDINLYKCKEKLFFGKEDVEKASLAGSDSKSSIEISYPKDNKKVIRTKFTISPKQIIKKPKKPSPPRKGSAPKGCLEGPRLCRSLPNLSTGCTSIQACSESAIAFSQRQMQDIESIAQKLMTELKSMKDIVEEKVLYESYRSASLKNDADEVKVAIKTATRTEETARKWLTMMSRDCTRFCKIMKLTDNDAPPTESIIQENTPPQREKKKISFADEAGGTLCNVKFFDDALATRESRSEP